MKTSIIRVGLAVAALAFGTGFPFAAQAQGQPQMPSYASGEETLHGTVSAFDGKYDMTLHDDRGFDDRVKLHDGTVINPIGLKLASGMTVTVYGHNDGAHFTASEIDTPYHRTYAYAYPYPVYGPYPYYRPYGYPYYGPYYGPAYSLRLGFGFR